MHVLSAKRNLWIALALLLALGIGGGLVATRMMPGVEVMTGGRPLIGGPFELVDHRGEPVTEATFAGRHMLIYFGYSYCPDICPMSLQTMTAAYDLLSAEEKAKVQPIFITVDPERDTVEAMGEYVSLFDDDLMGLTGTLEQIKAAAKTYRVYHAKAVDESSSADYLVDHSSFYYLMGPDGQYVRHFGHAATMEEIAEGVQATLQ